MIPQQTTIPRRTLYIFIFLAIVFLAQMVWWIIFNFENSRETLERLKHAYANEQEIVSSVLNRHFESLADRVIHLNGTDSLEFINLHPMVSGYQADYEEISPDSLSLVVNADGRSILIFINRAYLKNLVHIEGKAGFSKELNAVIMNPSNAISPENILLEREWLSEIEEESSTHTRMLIMEGSFFIFLIIVGLWMIYSAMKRKKMAAEEQTLFIHSITHELKIPITSVNLFLDTIKRRDYEPEMTRNLLPKMKEDLRRLNSLIDNILNIRKLSEQRDKVLPKVDLSREVRALIVRIREKVESLGGEIEEEIAEGIMIRAQAEELQRVWDTLIDNSLKYTSDDDIKIVIKLKRSGSKAVFEISDNGPGIPPEMQDRLFKKFSRGEDEKSRAVPGSGLGLYIAREYIVRNGGTIEIGNHEEGGCRVTMRFNTIA